MNAFFNFFFEGSFLTKTISFFYTIITTFGINPVKTRQLKTNTSLYNEIIKMDSIYFNAYNKCDIKTQAFIFDKNIKFYDNKLGAIVSKKELVKSIQKNICGKTTRSLVKNSTTVYPIKNYGALQIGYHKFNNPKKTKTVSEPSKFIITWKKQNNNWKITKVINLF